MPPLTPSPGVEPAPTAPQKPHLGLTQVTEGLASLNSSKNKTSLNITLQLTIVQILHGRLLGEAWIKVRHKGGDVLRCCQHAVCDLPHENKPWGWSEVRVV